MMKPSHDYYSLNDMNNEYREHHGLFTEKCLIL